MERRRFLQTLALSSLAAGAPTALAADSATKPSSSPATWLVAGPDLQAPTETSMSLVWMTAQNCACHVEFGPDENLGQRAHASIDGLLDANSTVHRVTLSGLKPGATYHYRIVAKPILKFQAYKVDFGPVVTSPVYGFTTLSNAAESIQFGFLNDVHDNIPVLRELVALAGDAPEMFFLNGDIVNDPRSEEHVVTKLLAPYGEFFAHERPYVFVRGNHETRGAYGRLLKDYLALPDGRYYYAFDHGPVHFTILDTGEDKDDSHKEYSGLVDFSAYRKIQREWILDEVASKAFKEAPFRVLVTHIPFTDTRFGGFGETDCRRYWWDLLRDARIDMHFGGHTHRPGISQPVAGKRDFPIVIGGGPQREKATVILAKATEQELSAEIIALDGNKKLASIAVPKR